MARIAILTKEMIASAGLEIVRKSGMEALTARALSKELNCSLSPLFTVYESMSEIEEVVKNAAVNHLSEHITRVIEHSDCPEFKAYGMALVLFAIEEPHLFHLIFLSNTDLLNGYDQYIDRLVEIYTLTKGQATKLMDMMWTYNCGLAVLCSVGGRKLSIPEISESLSSQFVSTIAFIRTLNI